MRLPGASFDRGKLNRETDVRIRPLRSAAVFAADDLDPQSDRLLCGDSRDEFGAKWFVYDLRFVCPTPATPANVETPRTGLETCSTLQHVLDADSAVGAAPISVDAAKAHAIVHRQRLLHHRHGVADRAPIADRSRLLDNPRHQRAGDANAAIFRCHIQSLRFAGLAVEIPKCNRARDRS